MKRLATPTLALALALGPAQAALADEAPIQPRVTVEDGVVQGVDSDGVTSFKGIPYAAPPVGALRWRAPQPAAPWSGVRDGSVFGHDCMQNYNAVPLPPGSAPAEDCLYLNVWRPSGTDVKNLPVLVWIYGGGFVNGSSSRLIYTGSRLAQQGIVVVSFNYRLGRFGTFAHPALTKAGADGGAIANYGYMDQLAALQWIKRNVAAFGGDPQKVTIMGESAGGMSVHNLVTSPLAQGLFRSAIIASGGNGGSIAPTTLADAEAVGSRFAASLGVAPNDPDALAKLRALPAKDVLGDVALGTVLSPGERTFSSPFPYAPYASDVAKSYQTGAFAHVPIMIGATSGDMGGREGMMIAGARNLANTIARHGVPTWYYRFSYVASAATAPRSGGAIHADDLPYYFDTVDIKYGAKTRPADQFMGHTIASYVVNFVKNGSPDGDSLPAWPRYTGPGAAMMDFSENGQAVSEPDPWAPAHP